jgi:hypothetical protein
MTTINYPNGDQYIGEIFNGKYIGVGTLLFANGDKYEGEFKDNRYHGLGVLIYASGDRYEGQFDSGHYHGRGTYFYANGDKYTGSYEQDHQHGRGMFNFANGDIYIGDFADDKIQGEGTLTFASGSKYKGQFEDGQPHGKGVRRHPRDEFRHRSTPHTRLKTHGTDFLCPRPDQASYRDQSRQGFGGIWVKCGHTKTFTGHVAQSHPLASAAVSVMLHCNIGGQDAEGQNCNHHRVKFRDRSGRCRRTGPRRGGCDLEQLHRPG